MPKNTSISLSDHFASFIDTQVQTERYGTASDVVRAGLPLLEEHDTTVKALQNALVEGEQSGDPQLFDFDEFKARKQAQFSQTSG